MTARLQNILVAVDGSDASNRAIDVAAEMARSAGGTLTIVSAGIPLSESQRADLRRLEGELADATDVLAQRKRRRSNAQVGRACSLPGSAPGSDGETLRRSSSIAS